MGIVRLNELPEGSGSLTNDDIFVFMDDPSGSGITKKISLSQISSSIGGGGGGSIVISNSGDNRILTSTGSGINAESNLTFDGSGLVVAGDTTIDSIMSNGYKQSTASASIVSSGLALDLSTSNVFLTTLNSSISGITINNADTSSNTAQGFTLIFTADGTARTVVWPTNTKWAGNTAPGLSSTSGNIDILSFVSTNGGSGWYGFVGGLNYY